MNETKIAELKKKYGEIYRCTHGDQEYYFRKPGRIEYKRYYDKLMDSVYDAACVLIFDLVIEPTIEELARQVEKNPGLPIKIVGRLTDFFGSSTLEVQKL